MLCNEFGGGTRFEVLKAILFYFCFNVEIGVMVLEVLKHELFLY
jgi:hypothetical protein